MSRHLKETERWKKIVSGFSDVSVTVLADLVADEFVFGEISRVSREAPVLILKHRERTVVPGGGGNAVMNLASLGVNVLPVGVVGDDEAGATLRDLLNAYPQIDADRLVADPHRPTTCKIRVMSGAHQLVRIDAERRRAGDALCAGAHPARPATRRA